MKFYADLDGLFNIQSELDRIFEDTFGVSERNMGIYGRRWNLPVDLLENDNEFLVKADLPGFNMSDIEIALTNNTLSIKAKTDDDDIKDYYRKERFVGQTQRNITFPVKIDRDKLSAIYKDGVLKIHCPKANEEKPKQICIECN